MIEEGGESRNNGQSTGRNEKGRFGPGNPGRPAGARHKSTLAIEKLLDGESEALTRALIDKAKGGDVQALRICMDRLAPPRKGRTVAIDFPEVENTGDVVKGLQAVIVAMTTGQLTPDEAVSVSQVLELKRKAIETVELEKRLEALEARAK